MFAFPRALRRLSLVFPIVLLPSTLPAQELLTLPPGATEVLPAPTALQTGDETPWIYRGSDVPQDKEWLWGEMDNGLRYAVRENGVPPGQVSIRIRIDAGSLHERDHERGFAHLLEHMVFRESQYLGPGEAIPRWQRLGATFGSDTNATTTPTQTVYQLDLPNASRESLAESFKLLSGMMRAPVINEANLAADLPIVFAEKRERGGAQARVGDVVRETLYAGQRLAERKPIGTDETLNGATAASVAEFHRRWYRPENTVIVVAGDGDPHEFAYLVEQWFGDWKGKGEGVEAPSFGDPVAPANVDPANPIGETAVAVEPGLPRSLTYAIMRPWRQKDDTVEYNKGRMQDLVAQAIINRRLEARARAGGSYLYAQVYQDNTSRSADATFVGFAPLSGDWQTALTDVRGVIGDALAEPPTQEEIEREAAEIDIALANSLEQATLQAGSQLADTVVQAVDIREAVASPQVFLDVFRAARAEMTPESIASRTEALFVGDVIRSVYVTPEAGEADMTALRTAMATPVAADSSSRLAARSISFDELPAIGQPGQIVGQRPIGLVNIEQVDFANGVKALLWSNTAEPGRVTVKVRFGSGERGFEQDEGPYKLLGEMALVGSGLGELGQEELDRISTGRKMGFDFAIEEGVFTFEAQTRSADVADQLYLFAAKLGMPRWDPNPVERAKAAASLSYESFASSPGGILNRDLDFFLRDRDPRFAMPNPEEIAATSPDGFREVWEPLLKQGPVEVLVFGEFDRTETIAALSETFGALRPRDPIPASAINRAPGFAETSDETALLFHRGDPDQAAAVISWPSGGGSARLRESRQLEILTQLFSNRLLEAMRERSGASYAPQVVSDWPVDVDTGGTITAFAQIRPQDVPAFFEEAEAIAADLAANPPTSDELNRVTEPLRQLIERALSSQQFWLYNLQGSTSDPYRVTLMRSLINDYSQTTPQAMQVLAQRYLVSRPGFRLAVIPEGQELAQKAQSGDGLQGG